MEHRQEVGQDDSAASWNQGQQWALPGASYSLLLALSVSLLVLHSLIRILKRRLYTHQTFKRMLIDGPKPHLIHGQLYDTRREAYVKYADKLHRKYGPTVGIYLGGDPYLLTKDLDLIQEVFVAKSRLFYDRMNFYLHVDPVPDNLICQRGDRWRYMRRLLTPAFTHSRIRSSRFYRDTWQTVRKLTCQLDANTSTGSEETLIEDSYDRMAALALDVIVKTAFHMDDMVKFSGPLSSGSADDGSSASYRKGKPSLQVGSCPSKRAPIDAFLDTVKRACRLGMNPLVELIFCFPSLDGPLTFICNQLYFSSILHLLYNRLEQLVRAPAKNQQPAAEPAASSAMKPGPEVSDEVTSRRRIIDTLIEVLRERKISRSEFTGNAFVIVFAGFETTANALTFTLWLLARDQRVQRKLRNLLRQKMLELGQELECLKPAGQQLDSSKLDAELAELATSPSLGYLEAVLNESLRLYPPVPGLSCRQASQDCSLSSGLRVERGVNVIPSVFSIHRDESIWGEDAHLFRPERFETLDDSQLNSARFMPFGLGPRNCIGKALAMHEMKIALGLLILGYSIELWPGRTPEKLRLCSPINITLTAAHKIPLKFVKLAS